MGYCWNDFVSNQRLLREIESRPITSIVRQRQLKEEAKGAKLTKFVTGASRCFLLGVNWFGKMASMGTCTG